MMSVRFFLAMLVLATCLGRSLPAFAQPRAYTFEGVDTLLNTHPRPVVVYIYTDWCKYCGAMKNSTLKNDRLISQLDAHFYFIMLNAEERSDIRFGGKTFSFRPTGAGTGVHDLAAALAGDNTGYPLLCILNDKRQITFQYNGFLAAGELTSILHTIMPGD